MFAADPRHRWISPVLYPLEEAKACWRRVSAHTLWVAGGDSKIMRQFAEHPEDYRERMACFAQVEEHRVENCGHNLHHDQPNVIAGLVDGFSTKFDGNALCTWCNRGTVLVRPKDL